MKIKKYILGSIIILLIVYYYVDRHYLMNKRVLRHHLWENTGGKRIGGDFIDTDNLVFHNDTMIFNYGNPDKDTLLLEWQYFNIMKIRDPKTGNVGKYAMKGANWINYLCKKIPYFVAFSSSFITRIKKVTKSKTRHLQCSKSNIKALAVMLGLFIKLSELFPTLYP